MSKTITVVVQWDRAPRKGAIIVNNGTFASARISSGRGKVTGSKFSFASRDSARLEIKIADARVDPGAHTTLVNVTGTGHPFSFFLRDVTAAYPIWIPAYSVMVTEASDDRTYAQIADAIRQRGLVSELTRIEHEPEATYEAAAVTARDQICETWLGLGRDMRIFAVGYNERMGYLGTFHPKNHGASVCPPENDSKPLYYNIVLGRGSGPAIDIKRHLDENVLPILHSTARDGDMLYETTSFVTLEKSPLTTKNLRGTDYLVADGHGAGNMLTPEQRSRFDAMVKEETEGREEETVLYYRAEITNTAATPKYAFLKGMTPDVHTSTPWTYDALSGFLTFPTRGVLGMNRLNGKPMPQLEAAVLVKPGEKVVFEFRLPHSPLPLPRARALMKQDFDKKLTECRAFWHSRLDAAARIRVPEQRVDEMIRAGLLHLDVIAYGKEPNGAVAACIGVYCPIGSESSPIVQFIDSMNLPKLAERSLDYFLQKQHDDGFIQNFGGYMLETGPALWSMGEHFRYTDDKVWVRRIRDKLVKSCDFLLAWRERNKTPALRGKGYGLIEGKVADPEDHFRQFMLNGLSYVGVQRVSEMLRTIDPPQSRRLGSEAEAWKQDIRTSLAQVIAESPVIPLGDGTWCPTAPPWAEMRGPSSLYVDDTPCFTHGTFAGRDSMIGPLYLILSEVVDANEPMGDILLKSNHELMTVGNVGFSQPYYCRHDYAHLRRGDVRAFLKLYYGTFAALADRQTYTFWEHYFGASPHKTHEEGWFLMQTRWMLWMEQGDTLNLLPAAPRAWFEDSKVIELDRVASYFGPISLRVESKLAHGWIEATIKCAKKRAPKSVRLRMPHSDGRKSVSVVGGTYDPLTETVTIPRFTGTATVRLSF